MKEYTDGWLAEGMDWTAWVDRVEMAKQSFATLINASSDEIAVLPSVSLAAAAVASALHFTTPRNKIVTTEMDFPSIGHVWLAQQSRGPKSPSFRVKTTRFRLNFMINVWMNKL